MCNQNSNTRNDGQGVNHVSETNSNYHSTFNENYRHVNASVESGGTTPIDVNLMTGNYQNNGGTKK